MERFSVSPPTKDGSLPRPLAYIVLFISAHKGLSIYRTRFQFGSAHSALKFHPTDEGGMPTKCASPQDDSARSVLPIDNATLPFKNSLFCQHFNKKVKPAKCTSLHCGNVCNALLIDNPSIEYAIANIKLFSRLNDKERMPSKSDIL